ncbi:MAG TPA: hypothetical protein VGH25_13960, partial [Dongiaceae bacterium]
MSLAEQSAPPRSRRPWTHILVFLAPAALIYTLFSIYPLLDTIRYALYSQDETGVAHFAGLKNFIDLLTHPVWADQFRNALVNNLIFFAIHVTVQNIIGIALAAMLSLPRLFGRNVY